MRSRVRRETEKLLLKAEQEEEQIRVLKLVFFSTIGMKTDYAPQ